MDSFNNYVSTFIQLFHQSNTAFLVIFTVFFLSLWFLPSLLALLFNRRHLTKIAMLNIPAGFSWIAWVGLCVWAVTGRMNLRQKAAQNLSAHEQP